ncbi:hypothetical protein G5V59_26160 [Nocardioides sp. W3-2-3]|uniref:hypothetical protein n=1 Tax=Nocardioides convexus TaxID=2712224 RepID=UPI0024183A7F|nr:hypothetical protein [Nocardioides convexus]NHA01939.1 hypothetical protein [Nocardioides convexus]
MDALERSVGTKDVHESWESREEQAERLRDRLLSRPTNEDLIQVAEWAQTLDETNEEDMVSLVRVLPWMDQASAKRLWEWDAIAFGRVVGRFAEHVATNKLSPLSTATPSPTSCAASCARLGTRRCLG